MFRLVIDRDTGLHSLVAGSRDDSWPVMNMENREELFTLAKG
jgi:hypothetical protein